MANTNTNIWMNNVHFKMVHDGTSATGKKFANVSFDCDASANGLASVSVNAGQVFTATDRQGQPKPDYRNILLGKAGTTRQVSVKQADGTYTRLEMTVEQIKAAFEAGRKAYRDAHKTATVPAVETAAATTEKKPARAKKSAKNG